MINSKNEKLISNYAEDIFADYIKKSFMIDVMTGTKLNLDEKLSKLGQAQNYIIIREIN